MNLLNVNLRMKPTHLTKLSRHQQTLRSFAFKSHSLAKRKRRWHKRRFIGGLLAALIPATAGLLVDLTKRVDG